MYKHLSIQPESGLGSLSTTVLKALLCYLRRGKTHQECFPHLRAQLAGLHFGLFLESVVSIVVSEGILNEGREHKHVANPEVNIQSLDG